ncbi:MAG: hypothetical protein AAF598_12920, partial [Bacteroidota bacterium]
SSALMKKVKLGTADNPDYLANYYIKIYDLHEKWRDLEMEQLYDYYYTSDTLDVNDEVANTVMRIIKSAVVKELLETEVTPGENIRMRVHSENEAFSLHLCTAIYEKLNAYYKESQMKKSQQTFDLVFDRTDSLHSALLSAEARLARFNDGNRGLFGQTSTLDKRAMERDVDMLQTVYFEAARNLESARFNLKNAEPVMRAIDLPVYPLGYKKDKLVPSIINGAIFGLISAILMMGLIRFIYLRYKKEQAAYQQELQAAI